MFRLNSMLLFSVVLSTCLLGVSVANGEVVVFPDPALDAAVRSAIGKPTGDILDTDLVGVGFMFLDADSLGISDLSGLEHCTDLLSLDLDSNQITDLSPLAGLTDLLYLDLRDNQITDITPISALSNLNQLILFSNQITDLSPLAGLTSLTFLEVSDNRITSLSALAGLTNLTILRASANQLEYISGIEELTNLIQLGLSVNKIRILDPIANLTNLTYLYLQGNINSWNQGTIYSFEPLAGLTKLNVLDLGLTRIFDLTPLTNLTDLTFLCLEQNYISDLTSLTNLTNLSTLWLHDNLITDIAPLVANAGLGAGDGITLGDNPLSEQALCEDIPQLLIRRVGVEYTGECVACTMFDVLEGQGDGVAEELGATLGLGTNYANWDIEGWPLEPYGDGIPDVWQLALFADAYCNDQHRLHSEATSVYEANLARLGEDKPEAAFAWTAAALGLSTEMRAAICEVYGLIADHYQVCEEPGKAEDEPFSATGDCDADETNNIDEYAYVVSYGAGVEAFVLAAGENSPFWQGNPSLPAAGIVGLTILAVGMVFGGARLATRGKR